MLEDLPIYEEGVPIGFVYQEDRHPPFYHIWQEGYVKLSSDDLVDLAGRVGSTRDDICFIDKAQLALLSSQFHCPRFLRTFTEKEVRDFREAIAALSRDTQS